MHLRFDFANAHGVIEPRLFRDPRRVIVARDPGEVLYAMEQVDHSLAAGKFVAGFVSYEAAPGFDPALVTQPSADLPLVCFGVFDAPAAAPDLVRSADVPDVTWTSAISPSEHRSGVDAIRRAIADGDTYQINYTFRLRATIDPATVPPLYAALARAERVPYGALVDAGDWQLLSLSPELFFRIERGRVITQPMKGTAPRGLWLADDGERSAALARSEKNRAENVMIVDLARNDITRVAEIGSVRATSLFHVDRYPSVLQMVSTVEGGLRSGASLLDVFRALFPAGSITGAPKSSSMRLIAGLEHAPRGAYCGAIGFAGPDEAVFSVAIRTATIRTADGHAEYGVGGGITWDSEAADEHAEALSKAACLVVRPEFELLETLRVVNGAPVRLDAHVDRLSESAEYFGFECDLDRVRRAVEAEAHRHPAGVRRLRIRMSHSGIVTVESREADPRPAGPLIVAVAAAPVNRRDRFLYHKTTARSVYERHAAEHPAAFDVLLWNDAREVTEFTRGNVVVELGGQLVTPPRECGLLNGVFRRELLERGEIKEKIVSLDDLSNVSRVWFVNSLREWVDVIVTGVA